MGNVLHVSLATEGSVHVHLSACTLVGSLLLTYDVSDWLGSDGVEGIVGSQCGAQLGERVPGGVGAEARHAD